MSIPIIDGDALSTWRSGFSHTPMRLCCALFVVALALHTIASAVKIDEKEGPLSEERGDVQTEFEPGAMLLRGENIGHREAARLFQTAADQGDAHSQATLAAMHRDGRGDVPKAVADDEDVAKEVVQSRMLQQPARGSLQRFASTFVLTLSVSDLELDRLNTTKLELELLKQMRDHEASPASYYSRLVFTTCLPDTPIELFEQSIFVPLFLFPLSSTAGCSHLMFSLDVEGFSTSEKTLDGFHVKATLDLIDFTGAILSSSELGTRRRRSVVVKEHALHDITRHNWGFSFAAAFGSAIAAVQICADFVCEWLGVFACALTLWKISCAATDSLLSDRQKWFGHVVHFCWLLCLAFQIKERRDAHAIVGCVHALALVHHAFKLHSSHLSTGAFLTNRGLADLATLMIVIGTRLKTLFGVGGAIGGVYLLTLLCRSRSHDYKSTSWPWERSIMTRLCKVVAYGHLMNTALAISFYLCFLRQSVPHKTKTDLLLALSSLILSNVAASCALAQLRRMKYFGFSWLWIPVVLTECQNSVFLFLYPCIIARDAAPLFDCYCGSAIIFKCFRINYLCFLENDPKRDRPAQLASKQARVATKMIIKQPQTRKKLNKSGERSVADVPVRESEAANARAARARMAAAQECARRDAAELEAARHRKSREAAESMTAKTRAARARMAVTKSEAARNPEAARVREAAEAEAARTRAAATAQQNAGWREAAKVEAAGDQVAARVRKAAATEPARTRAAAAAQESAVRREAAEAQRAADPGAQEHALAEAAADEARARAVAAEAEAEELRAVITALQATAPPANSGGVGVIECVICFEMGESRCVLIPCGHLCVCPSCSRGLAHCPLCRKPVECAQNLYHA